jgi:hypothetical protein
MENKIKKLNFKLKLIVLNIENRKLEFQSNIIYTEILKELKMFKNVFSNGYEEGNLEDISFLYNTAKELSVDMEKLLFVNNGELLVYKTEFDLFILEMEEISKKTKTMDTF